MHCTLLCLLVANLYKDHSLMWPKIIAVPDMNASSSSSCQKATSVVWAQFLGKYYGFIRPRLLSLTSGKQWSIYFKTTHGTQKMWPYIAGGLKIKVI